MKELMCLAGFVDEANSQQENVLESNWRVELSTAIYGKVNIYAGSTLMLENASVRQAEVYLAWLISPMTATWLKNANIEA